LKLSAKLVIIVVFLVVVLVIAVYGLTVLFTQTVPSTTVKGPSGSPSAVGDCSTLTNSPNTITLSASSPTGGVMNVTCVSGPAFTVTSEGLFTATLGGGVCSPSGICNFGSYGGGGFTVLNYSTWQNQGCSSSQYVYPSPTGYGIPFTNLGSSGGFITLSKGDYVYCLGYYLQPYSTNSPTSLPSFTITWNSP